MRLAYKQPLDPFRPGAYRPQRWDAVLDLLDDGYVQRLPPRERQYMARFLREAYGANATALRTGLHADTLKPEAAASLPRRLRRWWGRQLEMWPPLALESAIRALGLNPANKRDRARVVDASRRRSVYAEQNAATRDVYSLRRVVYLEELGGRE